MHKNTASLLPDFPNDTFERQVDRYLKSDFSFVSMRFVRIVVAYKTFRNGSVVAVVWKGRDAERAFTDFFPTVQEAQDQLRAYVRLAAAEVKQSVVERARAVQALTIRPTCRRATAARA